MRYIGSKVATLPAIQSIVERFAPNARSLCDPFAGTCTVSRHFKSLGLRVETGDLLWASYVFQRATIALNTPPAFSKLFSALDLDNVDRVADAAPQILNRLQQMPGRRDFVTECFSDAGKAGRRFFTVANAERIDAIRGQIAEWSADNLIDELEEAYLLACLIDASDRVANTAGTYMAHLKQWGRKSLRPLEMRGVPIVDNALEIAVGRAQAWETAATEVDVLYLDPPYNTRTIHSIITCRKVSRSGMERLQLAKAASRPNAGIRSPIFASAPVPRPHSILSSRVECAAHRGALRIQRSDTPR